MFASSNISKQLEANKRLLSTSVVVATLLIQTGNEASGQAQQDIANIPVSPQSGGQQMQRNGNPSAYVPQWFGRYDQIRRQAQMTPAEKMKSDTLMAKGMGAMLGSGPDKGTMQVLLTKMVSKYSTASEQMKQLPLYPETEKLHRGYYQYFSDAKRLFSDYLRVQTSIFAVDDETGKPVVSLLMARKQNLENLDIQNKALDDQLRKQFGIAPYQY
ncbi:MAG: hypothetical protein IAF58_21020 [Leptolyngbya sp.]|nr:hypothetical protein [Candidatus Melainabacteria bacterium]